MTTAPFHVFGKGGVLALGAKLANLSSDSLKCLLLTNAYNPSGSLASGEFVQDIITAGGVEVSAGNGYSTGGVALSSVGWATTAANSWSTTWAASTAFSVGAIIRPATGNGYVYQNVAISGTGTSGASSPSFPTTVGLTVVDNSGANQITWLCIGVAVTVLSAANIVFTSSGGSITGYYGVIYDSTPGTYSTDPALGYYDISNGGSGLTGSGGGTITITVPTPSGIFAIPNS